MCFWAEATPAPTHWSGACALSTHQLNRPVGSTYEYTAVNQWVLGLLVQTVSGQSFEDYVQQHIFTPLDMRNTYLSPIEARTHGMATGYRFWFGRPVAFEAPYQRAEAPATWLIASAEDMAHFLSAQLGGGRYGNASILSPEGITAMQQAVVPQGNRDMYWGMGWDVGQLNGIPAVWLWGDGPNVHAKIVLVPAGRWGIVVMENAEPLLAKAMGDRRIDQTAVCKVP
jgi:CubicO group peptidase (beta-lactamase class C family)